MDDDVIQDDHLDFIFVEGYLRNNSLSLPMTFTGFENAAELSVTVRFQRVCDDNFHGVACTTFCDPTNGSYECSANGSKICLPGYGNPDNNCLESEESHFIFLAFDFHCIIHVDIDDCSSDPCHNGGSCTVRFDFVPYSKFLLNLPMALYYYVPQRYICSTATSTSAE